jgi:hypothetical protein
MPLDCMDSNEALAQVRQAYKQLQDDAHGLPTLRLLMGEA